MKKISYALIGVGSLALFGLNMNAMESESENAVIANDTNSLAEAEDGPLFEKNDFDWSTVFEWPYETPEPGKSGASFFSTDRSYKSDPGAIDFVDNQLQSAKPFEIDAQLMRYALDSVTIDGYYLEMGVCRGVSINMIAALTPEENYLRL